jgi:hypothetical protein
MTLPTNYISPLHCALNALEQRLKSFPPDPRIIERAKDILNLYPRHLVPDWVEAIANGKPDQLAAVIEVALDDIKASALMEGKEDAS